MKKTPTPACVGRPRGFDTDEALEKAMKVFWQKGYEGASLSDLTEAMGINRPSLYAAYGNKEELFRKALDRYGAGPASYMAEALKAPTAREVIEKLLYGSVEKLNRPGEPRGCLAVQSALCCGDEGNNAQREAQSRRLQAQGMLRERFDLAEADGDLPPGVNAADLAAFVAIVMNGLSVQSSNGATCEQMRGAVKIALKALDA